MALASEVTWPTEFADLKRLDATLKCGICYDYMTNSMITSCSHTYCSLCIRKFMQYKNQCPACFEETYEIHLRNNRPLDEVISIFVKMKDKLQRALRLATIPIPIKENKCTEEAPPQTPQNKMKFEPKTPSSVRRNTTPGSMFDRSPEKQPSTPNSSKTKPSCSSQTGEDFVFNGVTIPGIFNTPITFPKCRKPEELAQCPVCHVDVPARNINIHLDSCLSVESDVCPKKSKAPPRRDPIPKRLYDLMQDKALKKVLKDYGLSTQGDRKTLIARIKRYTVIYNSENDSPNPRPVSELIAQLEREEREERRPNTLMKSFTRANQQQRITIDRKADPDVIDQAHKTYREENKDHFKKLIEQMRAREGKNIKPLKPPARVYSDDEDDPNHSVQFDPTVPSTSREDLYSLATQPNDDSDSDIFQEPEEKGLANGRIDWNKTGISEKDTLIVVSDDEAVDSVQPRQDLAVDCNQEGSGKCDAVSESHRETESTADHSPGSVLPVAIPPSKVLENHHILHSSPTGPNKSCTGDSNSSFSDVVQSMKQNDTTSNERSPRSKHCSTIPLAERIDLQHSEESNDADALFEKCNGDEMGDVTPRRTRTNRRSVPKSQSSTPSTSTRGTKRKSEESPETKMVDTFDYLFERFNGDRVNVDIESEDETTSGPLISEDQPEPAPRCTRRSTRSRKSAVVEESEETNSKTSRKRTKKDLSPAF